nr:hypothetical protein [Humibacter ginsenosidimutans]
MLAQLFLALNGLRHTFTVDEAFEAALAVAQSEIDVEAITSATGTHLIER